MYIQLRSARDSFHGRTIDSGHKLKITQTSTNTTRLEL